LCVGLGSCLYSVDKPITVLGDQVFKWPGCKSGFNGLMVRGSKNLKNELPAELWLAAAKAVHFLERPKIVLPFALTKDILLIPDNLASVVLDPGGDQLGAVVRGHDG
jgi:hypothetical protein